MSCECERQQHSGLGLIDEWGDDGGDGGIIGALAAIGAGIASMFGFGGDDQATSYKPPADSATRFVSFSDKLGNEQVAYDATSAASLQQGIANGNRLEDIYSYYSAFITGNVNSGASSAAAEVIRNTAAAQGVSIQRAADIILKVVGLYRTVRQLFTQPTTPTTTRPPTYQAPTYQTPQYQQPVYQQPAPTAQQGIGDNSLLLFGGGFLLLLLLARRRD